MRVGSTEGLYFLSSVFNRADKTIESQRDIESLSSGKRINRAADDAAGLSISQKLTSKIRGNEQAKKNIGDGISMLQTADVGLSSALESLQRIRELKVQSLNGTNSTNELNAMQREINAQVLKIREISESTEFNGRRLMHTNNSANFNIRIQTGSQQNNTRLVRLRAGSSGTSVPSGTGIEINVQDGNANARGELNEGLAGIRFDSLHLPGATVNSLWSSTTNNSTTRNTAISLDQLDIFLGNVTRMRTFIGSEINALEASLDNLDIKIENQISARQRIEDVDIAKASSNLIKHQIQNQSAAIILGQARNIQKDIVLNLIP